jgi:hypothetical protein
MEILVEVCLHHSLRYPGCIPDMPSDRLEHTAGKVSIDSGAALCWR